VYKAFLSYCSKPLAESSLDEYHTWEKSLDSERLLIPNHRYPHRPPRPVPLPVLPARICTVSHCHKILPGHYKFRRCVEHRKQNRYHSNLKRIREKERKANGPDGVGVGSAPAPTGMEAARNKTQDDQEKESIEQPPDIHTGMAQDSQEDIVSMPCVMDAETPLIQLHLTLSYRLHPDRKATFVLSKPASTFFPPVCPGRCARLVGLVID
jgi:hypothetical protein